MKSRLLPALLLMLIFLPESMAKTEYTYVKASLSFPWFMFFVFLLLIMIPFLLIVFLSWRKQADDESEDPLDQIN